MAFTFHVGATIAIASAVAMTAFGLLVLRLEPRDGTPRTFALFVLIWSVQVVAGNTMALTDDPSIVYPAALTFEAAMFVVGVPLLAFAISYPPSRDEIASPRTVWWSAGAVSLAALSVLAWRPDLFVEAVYATDGIEAVTFGPLSSTPFVAMIGAFLAGAAIIAYRLHRSSTPDGRSRLALLLAAFLLVVSADAGEFPAWVSFWREQFLSTRDPISYGVIVALLGLSLAFTVAVLAWFARDRDLPWRRLVIACGTVPPSVTVAATYARAVTGTTFGTSGLWRLGMVGVLGYAIVRFRLFDLEPRLRDAAPVAAYLLVSTLGIAALWATLGDLFDGAWLFGVTASLGVAAVAWPTMTLTETQLERRLGYLDAADYLYERKVQVYRSALEDARARGEDEAEQRFLADLRDRLGISEDEHRAIVAVLDGGDEGPEGRQTEDTKFEIHEELGRGSLGRALRATDTTLDREVVLKEAAEAVRGDRRELFVREAQLAAQLNHPNVVQIYEVLPDRNPPMLVLEYVEEGSLRDRVEDEGPLPLEAAIAVAADVLTGLEALHAEGIVHRDVKPANVLLAAEGQAKLTDLGVARAQEDHDLRPTLTVEGRQPGTIAYMSPEQAEGEAVDERTDLYAVGATLYYALTGDHYLGSAEGSACIVRESVIREPPKLDHPEIPASLRPVLAGALEKSPEERYETAAAMRAELPSLEGEGEGVEAGAADRRASDAPPK